MWIFRTVLKIQPLLNSSFMNLQRIIITTLGVFFTLFMQAQPDQGFNYQAVIRDPGGAILSNTSVNLRFQVFQTSPSGNLIYQESHSPTTNQFGLVVAVIGKGTPDLGDFDQIDWMSDEHYLIVEVSGAKVDTLLFETVPYAKVATQMKLPDLQDVEASNPIADQTLKWDGAAWVPADDLVDDADSDATNELQTLSLTGADLSLSDGGGTVSLPTYTAGTGIDVTGGVITNTGDLDPFNEIQTLSLAGADLTLSQSGGTVTLPTYTAGTGIDVTGSVITNTGDTDPGDDITLGSVAGGDLGGTFPSPSVVQIQGNPVGSTTPTSGQVLKWDGSAWAPATDNAGTSVWSLNGSDAFYTSGQVGIGTSSPDGELEVFTNSSLSDPHILLHENGNDYARLNFDNNNGSNYWTIAAYIASNVKNDRLNFWNGSTGDLMTLTGDGQLGLNVGISPKTSFHIGDGHRVLFGTDTLGSGDKLMFLPDLHAFRVGSVATGAASTYWNRDSIGLYSFASGLNTRAQGFGATAMGRDTEATNSYAFASGFFSNADGQYATAMGFNTDALALGSTALGYSTDAEENYSFAAGYFAEAQAIYSVAIGNSVRAQSYASMAVGRYNVGGGSATSWNTGDPIFEIGIGTGPSSRANAVTVRKNGNVGIGTTVPLDRLHVNGRVRLQTVEYIEDGGTNEIAVRGDLRPTSDNTYDLGTSSLRWDDVYATSGTVNTSDLRLKENIQPIAYGLEEVMQLKPISYTWIEAPYQGVKLGLGAQDLLEVIPEVVKTTNFEPDEETGALTEVELEQLGVYYSDLIPVLIQATQDQQAIIEAQEARIRALEEKLEALAKE